MFRKNERFTAERHLSSDKHKIVSCGENGSLEIRGRGYSLFK